MLRKLLKYDFGAVIKLWCIGALAVLVLAFGGGFCMRVLFSGRNLHGVIMLTAGLGIVLCYLGMWAFSILTLIFLLIRFYRNFFTDEGYLTFTLPVKLHTVLNSKIILVFTMMFMTGLWMCIAYLITYTIGLEEFSEVLKAIGQGIKELDELCRENQCRGWIALYIVEVVLISVFSALFSHLFIFCCITFGSIVAKKAKVAAAIGIYFGANCVFSIILSIFMSFGMSAFVIWIGTAEAAEAHAFEIIALTLFGIMALEAMLCSMLYTLQYRLLDRKLNLP